MNIASQKLSKIIACSEQVAYDYLATLRPDQYLDMLQLLNNGTSQDVERFTGLAIPFDNAGKPINLTLDEKMERAASKTMDAFLAILP